MRYDERGLAYVFKRTAKGTSKREITRCLKRYIARQVFRALLNLGAKKHECEESLKVEAAIGTPHPQGGRFKAADCQAECNISLKTSLAVLYFRTFLARSQISSTTCCTSSFVTFLKSLPLGEELAQEPIGVLNC